MYCRRSLSVFVLEARLCPRFFDGSQSDVAVVSEKQIERIAAGSLVHPSLKAGCASVLNVGESGAKACTSVIKCETRTQIECIAKGRILQSFLKSGYKREPARVEQRPSINN